MSTLSAVYSFIKHVAGDTPWWSEVNANYDSIDGEIAKPRYPFTSPTVAATTTLDLSTARSFVFTVSQATTIAFTNVPSASFYVPVELIVTNGSAFAITWPASVSWLGGVAPTFKASGVDVVDLATKDAGVTWYATLRNVRPGVLYQKSGLSTTSTTDVSVASFAIPANSLAVNGQAIRITVCGRYVGANTGTINLRYGATQVFGVTTAATDSFQLVVHVSRTGAATELSVGSYVNKNTASAASGAPAETLSNAITMDFRGNITTAGTLFYDYVMVELLATA